MAGWCVERNLLINILRESMDNGEIRYSDASRLADVFLKMANGKPRLNPLNNQEEVKSINGVLQDPVLEDIRFTTRLLVSGINSRI